MKNQFRTKSTSASKRKNHNRDNKKNTYYNPSHLLEHYTVHEKQESNFQVEQYSAQSSNYNRKSSAKAKPKSSIGIRSISANVEQAFPTLNSIIKYQDQNTFGCEEDISDELALISNLWEDLGVKDKYKKLFESTIEEYEKSIRTKLINLENNSLQQLKNLLTKIAKEISNRENTIDLIKRINEYVSNDIRQGYKDIKEELLQDIIKTFKNLRIYSVNVISLITRFKEKYHYYSLKGKFDFSKANSDYNFNDDYLNKMKTDLNFLKTSYLGYYFCFSKESDPFLLSLSVGDEIMKTDKNEYCKYLVPINNDVLNAVIQGEYLMVQDCLLGQLQLVDDCGNIDINAQAQAHECTKERNTLNCMSMMDLFKGDKTRRLCVNRKKRTSEGGMNMSQLMFHMKQNPNYNALFISSTHGNRNGNGNDKKDRNNSVLFTRDIKRNSFKTENEDNGGMSRRELLYKFEEMEKNQYGDSYNDKGKVYGNGNFNGKGLGQGDKTILRPNSSNNRNKAINKESKKPKDSISKSSKDKQIRMKEIKENDLNSENESNMNTKLNLHVQYDIKFYTKSLLSFETFYNQYYPKLSIELKSTFNLLPPSSIDFLQGINPKLITASSQDDINSIIGMCLVLYESSIPKSAIKLKINHLSAITPNWEKVLISLIEYIKQSFEYDSIEISFHYQYDNGHFTINKDLLSLFKEQLGFKWLKIENKNNKERIQYLIYQYDDNDSNTNKDNSTSSQSSLPLVSSSLLSSSSMNLISIKTSTIISLSNSLPPSSEKPKSNIEKYISLFNVHFLLNKLKEQGYQLSLSFPSDKSNDETRVQWNTEEMHEACNQITSANGISLQELKKALKHSFRLDNISSELLNQRNPSSSSPPPISYCLIDIKPQIQSNISIVKDGIMYNRIKGNINILADNEIKQKVYLIPTEDNIHSLLICEMTPQLKNIIISSNNNNNINENFFNYYLKLHQDPNNKTLPGSLWIPSFKIISHLMTHNPICVKDIVIEDNEGSRAYINTLDEYVHAEYSKDPNYRANFLIEPEYNDIVIKNAFLFGLVNSNLLSKLHIPTIVFLIVTESNWEYVNKNKVIK